MNIRKAIINIRPSGQHVGGEAQDIMYQKQKKDPLSIVIKSPKTVFDPFAFGDGDETIMFFLEFDSYFDTSSIKSEIITINTIPIPTSSILPP